MTYVCLKCELSENRCKCEMPEIDWEGAPIEVPESIDEITQRKIANFSGEDKIDNVAALLRVKHKFLTLKDTNEILKWTGKIYSAREALTSIKTETEKLIPQCTTFDRNEVINKIKVLTYIDHCDFDSDPNLITVLNGVLDIDTLELIPHDPKLYSKVLLPVEYISPISDDIEAELDGTVFLKFLKNSFTVNSTFNREAFETVLEITASFLIKTHVDERAFMFLGNGENGKSVLLHYLLSLLGKENVSSISLQDIADDKFLRANLAFKMANIFPDLEKNELRRTGKIKAIISNEGVEVQEKHKQGFTLYPFCKLVFSTNRFPKVFDESQGFFRRWIIVKWERSFEGDPARIEYLREMLEGNQAELNKVFSSLVQLAKKIHKQGKFTHSKPWKEIQEEWNKNADPVEHFIRTCLIDSELNSSKREIYQEYKRVMLEKGDTPLGIGQFGKSFSEYYDDYVEKEEGFTRKVWCNVDVKIPEQTILMETVDQ